LQNPLGWRLYERPGGHRIAPPNPLVRRCLLLLGPMTVYVLLLLLAIWLRDGRIPSFHGWGIMIVMILMGLVMSWRRSSLVDRPTGFLRVDGARFHLAHFTPLLYHVQKKDRYVIYAHDGTPRRFRTFSTHVIWESADRSEAVGVLDDVFGITVLEEGPGMFEYTQRRIWDRSPEPQVG